MLLYVCCSATYPVPVLLYDPSPHATVKLVSVALYKQPNVAGALIVLAGRPTEYCLCGGTAILGI